MTEQGDEKEMRLAAIERLTDPVGIPTELVTVGRIMTPREWKKVLRDEKAELDKLRSEE